MARKDCGLCGNYNDDATDDFIGPDGQQFNNANEFVASWVVDNTTSCGTLAQGPSCFGSARATADAILYKVIFLLLAMLQLTLNHSLMTALMTTAFSVMKLTEMIVYVIVYLQPVLLQECCYCQIGEISFAVSYTLTSLHYIIQVFPISCSISVPSWDAISTLRSNLPSSLWWTCHVYQWLCRGLLLPRWTSCRCQWTMS